MQVPPEITFHGVSASDWNEEYIREQMKRLERFNNNITACRIAVEKPHRNHEHGNAYRVRIELTLPKHHDLVVVKERNEDPHVHAQTVIRKAFDAMERKLKEVNDRRTKKVKSHTPSAGAEMSLPEDDETRPVTGTGNPK